jgi:hypothetical protein
MGLAWEPPSGYPWADRDVLLVRCGGPNVVAP